MRSLGIRPVMLLIVGAVVIAGCGDFDDDPTSERKTGEATQDSSPTATSTQPGPTSTPDSETIPAQSAEESSQIDVPHYEFPSGNQEVYLLDLDTGEQQRLTDDQNQYDYPAWSPDGSRIAIVSSDRNQPGERLFIIDSDGSNPVELTDQASNGPIDWSPDGETIAFAASGSAAELDDEVYLIDADGSNLRQVTNRESIDPDEQYYSPHSPSWSPAGESIVFTAVQTPLDGSPFAIVELWTVEIDGDGVPEKLTDSREIQKGFPTWIPNGERIGFRGTVMDEHEEESTLYTVDATGDDQSLISNEISDAIAPAWSSDGERIAFVREQFGSLDIYAMDTDGGNIAQLTDDEHSNTAPDWSPDGNRIAFIANRDPRVAEPCSTGIDIDYDPYVPIDELSWMSEQIIVGTIIEELEPAWAEPDVVIYNGDCLEIMSDYIVEVEAQFHGNEAETLRVRVPGGEIGEYFQHMGMSPEMEVGDRFLMFLFAAPDSEFLPDSWGTDVQRTFEVNDSDQVIGMNQVDESGVVDLDQVGQEIRAALGGEPPAGTDPPRALWGRIGADDNG